MVSKCANPACWEKFLRLHEGKIFRLSPTPEVEAATGGFAPALYEKILVVRPVLQADDPDLARN